MRWAALVGTLAATAVAGVATLQNIRSDTSDERFLSSAAEASTVLEALRATFGRDSLFQLLVTTEVFSEDGLRRLSALHRAVAAVDIEVASQEGIAAGAGAPQRQSDSSDSGWSDGGWSEDDWGEDDWGDDTGGSIVDEVISLVTMQRTERRPDGLFIGGLLEDLPGGTALAELKARVLSDPALVGQVVDEQGTHAVLAVRTRALDERGQSAMLEALEAVAAAHDAPGFRVQVGGAPAISASLREMLISDTITVMAVSSVLLLLVSFFLFRHPLGVLGPILVVWQAEVWTLGAMTWTDTPLTMATSILPTFIGCVGLGDSVHIQSVYRSARAAGLDNDDAIVRALQTTGVPVVLTTLTTAVGLLSFRFASLSAIQEMGTFGALGVLAALFNSVLFLPALLTFNQHSLLGLDRKTGRTDWIANALDFCNRLSAPDETGGHRRRNGVLVAGGALFALAAGGASLIAVHHNGLEWFPEDHPTRRAVTELENSVGGTANLALLIEAKPGRDLRQRELVRGMAALQDHLSRFPGESDGRPGVRNVTSVVDPIVEVYRALRPDPGQHLEHDARAPMLAQLPATERGVRDMFTLLENTAPQRLQRLMTSDGRRGVMTVRATWTDAHSYLPIIAHMRTGVAEHLDGLADARPTGSVFVAVSVVNAILEDLLRSFGTAALAITLLMVLMLRDVKLGLLAMLPNLLPVLVVVGLMGFIGVPLDTSTLMLGSVAIGIVVDDTIHFLHQFKAGMDRGDGVDGAIELAMSHTGRAMIATSLMLAAGFCSVVVGQLLSSRTFGLLVATTVVVALLVDLTFLPALLRALYAHSPSSPPTSSRG